jgi:AAA+ superfamily predicted ATPase
MNTNENQNSMNDKDNNKKENQNQVPMNDQNNQDQTALNGGQSRPSEDENLQKNSLSPNIESPTPEQPDRPLSKNADEDVSQPEFSITTADVSAPDSVKTNVESSKETSDDVSKDQEQQNPKKEDQNSEVSELDSDLYSEFYGSDSEANSESESQVDSEANSEAGSDSDKTAVEPWDNQIDPESGLSVSLTRMIEEDAKKIVAAAELARKNRSTWKHSPQLFQSKSNPQPPWARWKHLTHLAKNELLSSLYNEGLNKYFLYSDALKVAKRNWREKIFSKLPANFIALFTFPLACLAARYIVTHPEEISAKGLQGEWKGLNLMIHQPEELTLKTCRVTGFLRKMDWEYHRRINYHPGSIFIVCHPGFRLSNDRFFIAEFQSKLSKTKHVSSLKQAPRKYYVLSSRQYNLLVPESFLYHNAIFDQINESENAYGLVDQTQLGRLQYWQQYYVQLDIIPIRTNSQFQTSHSGPLFKHIHKHRKKVATKKRFRFLFGKRGAPKIVSEEKRIEPLIHKLGESFIQTSSKQSKVKKGKVRSHEQPYQSQLCESLIQTSPFSKSKFRGKHRFYDYKMANSMRAVKEVLSMHVHTSPIMVIDDQHIEVDYYFKRHFCLSRCLTDLTDYERPRNYSPYEINNNLIDMRLRNLLHEDVARFNDQQTPDTTRLAVVKRKRKFLRRKKSKSNPFASLYLTRKRKRTTQPNPFDFLRGKQRKYDFYRLRSDHKVLPHFQTGFDQYMQHQLDHYGLKPDKCHLAFPLRKPFKTSYELKGVRIRRSKAKQLNKLRSRVIESESPVLKRKFSGYLFPDSDLDSVFSHQARWKNRFFIQNSGFDDDVFIMISGPEPDLQWMYRSLMNMQKNHIPNQLQTIPSYGFETSRLFEKRDNFYGQLEPDFGVIFHDQETKKPPRYRPTNKKWLRFMREPDNNQELFEDKRKYELDPKNPFGPNADEVKKAKHPMETSWGEEPRLFMDNQRCLPLPVPQKPIRQTLAEREFPPLYQTEPSWKLYSIPRIQQLGEQENDYLTWKGTHNQARGFFKFSWPAQLKDLNVADWATHYQNYYGGSIWWPVKFDAYTVTQLIIAYYVFKYFRDVYYDYRDDFWEGLELFLLYLNLEDLLTFKSLATFVSPPTPFTFQDMRGGLELIREFYPIVLFLKLRRTMFSSIDYNKRYTASKLKFSRDHMFNQEAYEKTKANPMPKDLLPPQKMYYKSNILAKGFLLVGSPGTGKTFLVKALSGETQCPVISTNAEKSVESRGKPKMDPAFEFTFTLRKMFRAAKLRSPCILFLDELDSMATRREFVLTGPPNTVVPGLLYSRNCFVRKNAFSRWVSQTLMPRRPDLGHQSVYYASVFKQRVSNSMLQPRTILQRFQNDILYRNKNVCEYLYPRRRPAHLLETTTVLLCELNDIESYPDVIVIGATNRPEVIDPAVIRPGRLGKIIYLDLPNRQKRFELLKFYGGENFDQNVDWDFFASYTQTGGLSPAHLKCIMNASALRLISLAFKNNQPMPSKSHPFAKNPGLAHTNATIQYGIEATRYRNLHVREVRQRLISRFNRLVCSESLYSLYNQPNPSFFFTDHVETHDQPNPSYIITNIDGIHLAPFQNYPSRHPSLAKQTPSTSQMTTENPNMGVKKLSAKQESICDEIFGHYFKKLRLRYLCTEKDRFFFNRLTDLDLPENTAVGLERLEQFITSDEDKRTWRLFKAYADRIWRPDVFGMKLLIDSPYALDNPLNFSLFPIFAKIKGQSVQSNFQWAAFPQRNIFLSQLIMRADQPSFLRPIEHKLIEVQEDMFGDGVALLRSAYYMAGKAMIIALLDDETMFDEVTLSLWSHIKGFEEARFNQQSFIHGLSRRLLTKRQFEKYLFVLVAGKMSEKFFLLQDPFNESNIGLSDLQQAGWLANVMVEKGLLYTTAPFTQQQTVIQEDNHPYTDKKTIRDGARNRPTTKLRKRNDTGLHHYWWGRKYTRHLNNYRDSEIVKSHFWLEDGYPYEDTDVYKLKVYDVRYEPSVYDTNTVTATRIETNFKHSTIDSERSRPLNQNRLTAILNSAEVQWNDFVRSDTQDIVSHLVFDACGKAFNVIVRNRPLLDLLVSKLLTNNQITGRDAKKLADHFLCHQYYVKTEQVVSRFAHIELKLERMATLFNFICSSYAFFTWAAGWGLTFDLLYYELITNQITATDEEIESVVRGPIQDDEDLDGKSMDMEQYYDGTPDYEPTYGPEQWDEIDIASMDDDPSLLFYDGTLYYTPPYAFDIPEGWNDDQIVLDTTEPATVDTTEPYIFHFAVNEGEPLIEINMQTVVTTLLEVSKAVSADAERLTKLIANQASNNSESNNVDSESNDVDSESNDVDFF